MFQLVDVFAVVFVRAKTRREKSEFLPFIGVVLAIIIWINKYINPYFNSSLQKYNTLCETVFSLRHSI